MEEKIKVSIIVPVYKVEKYLNRSMDSLVNQTLDGVEIGYSVMEQYQGKGIGTQALALAVEIALKISECVYLEILEIFTNVPKSLA